jgi:ABC-type transporter Mla subunit MlaD
MAGNSDIGRTQAACDKAEENLKQTAGDVDTHVQALGKTIGEMQEAMGDTHQQDVPEQLKVVATAMKELGDCRDTIQGCAAAVARVEART